VRFEPGETKTVKLVEIAGRKIIQGGNNLASGPLSEAAKSEALRKIGELKFANE
jgi:urease beta subunit